MFNAFPDLERKGQQVLTAILLTVVILTVSLSSYFWGREILEKSRDQRNFQEMETFVRNLNDNIKEVSRRGGRTEMTVDLPDGAEININEGPPGGMDNITLDFSVRGQMMATGQDIAIVGSKGSETPIVYSPDVIVARSEGFDDFYSVKLKLYYKNSTVGGEPQSRIGIDAIGRRSSVGGTTDIIIQQGPRENYNGFTVNKVEVRII